MTYNPKLDVSISKQNLSVKVGGCVPGEVLESLFSEIVDAAISAPSNFKPIPSRFNSVKTSVKRNKKLLMVLLQVKLSIYLPIRKVST